MGIVPITTFSGICAEADNPKLLADTDTVSSAAAVVTASRRVNLCDLISPPRTLARFIICVTFERYPIGIFSSTFVKLWG
jgi:hypothetical protein